MQSASLHAQHRARHLKRLAGQLAADAWRLFRDVINYVWQSGYADSVPSFRTYRRIPWRLIARDPLTGRLTAAVSHDHGRTWELITQEGRFPCPDDPRTWPGPHYQNRPF